MWHQESLDYRTLMSPGAIGPNTEALGGNKENERVGKFLFGPVVIIHVQRQTICVCDNCIVFICKATVLKNILKWYFLLIKSYKFYLVFMLYVNYGLDLI